MYWCCTGSSGTHARQAAERLDHCPAHSADRLAGDLALRRWHARDPPASIRKPVTAHPRRSARPAGGRLWPAPGRCRTDWPGRRSAGTPHPPGRRHPSAARGPSPPRAEQVHLEPEAVRGGRLAPDLDQAIGVAGKAQAAVPLPAGRLPGLGLEGVVQLDRMLRSWVMLALVRSWPTRPAAWKVEPEVSCLRSSSTTSRPARARQVIRDRAADDAAADDHGTRVGGQAHRRSVRHRREGG